MPRTTSKSTPKTGPKAALQEPPEVGVDAAAELAVVTADPAPPPEWAPSLKPMASLTRRQRAEFFDKIRDIPMDADGNITLTGDTSMGTAVAMFKLIADVEDALVFVAIGNDDAVRKSIEDVSDEDLMELFNWYMGQMEPGEARSSAN